MLSRRGCIALSTGLVLSLVLFIAGCGGPKSPSDVVREFYTLANEGKFEDASQYLSSEARLMFGVVTEIAEGLRQYTTEEWSNLGIRKVEITGERVQGNQAEVSYILHFSDGSESRENGEILVKEDGQWKIGLGF